MAKKFNITGVCVPEKHYMVNLDDRLEKIKHLVDEGMYFTINKGRQFGKTTILWALDRYLSQNYHVVFMDFQTFGAGEFETERIFARAFGRTFLKILKKNHILESEAMKESAEALNQSMVEEREDFMLQMLFEALSDICSVSDKPMILMIDEVDSAANNQVFIDFLSQLRAYYIWRTAQPTFQSVILAGVYDVRNLVRKLRPEEEHKVNSPWNIAADFGIEMSFSKDDIAGMLQEYEADSHTGMDIEEMADLIYRETSGYPFLVSRLCMLMDEKVRIERVGKSAAWTLDGFMKANGLLTAEKNMLFESLIGRVINDPEIDRILQDKIFNGQTIAFTASNPVIDLAYMFGIVKNENGVVVPANKIFAKVLSDYYLSLAEMKSLEIYRVSQRDKNQFLENERLNMRLVIERFIEHFTDLYGHEGQEFIEKEGRKYFLLYLRPIINGTGHYSMESVTSSDTRTDLIVYYREEFFIIETKIWRGLKNHQKGERQLLGYMENYHKKEGYLLTFNFNKEKEQGIKEVEIDGKLLVEAMV